MTERDPAAEYARRRDERLETAAALERKHARYAWARLATFLVACTLALIYIGGLVTSTESGLAVPDWPLSYGMLMPPMVGGLNQVPS